MSRPSRLFVSLFVLVSLLAVPGAVAGDAVPSPAAQADSIDRTFTVSLTPDDPGTIRVELGFEVPSDVTSLSTRLPEGVTVRSTDGFQRRSGTTFEWTRTTDTPSITYDLDVNQSISRGTEGETTGGFLYVDTGEWAIARAPRSGVTFSGTSPQPELVTDYAFTGQGATSGDILYLGPFEEHRRTAAGQQLRLVVPAAASLESPPEAVLDSLASAAETLAIGPRDPEVVAIAAPTTVEWGSTGLQRGESDFWVLDDQGVNTPSNVWIHEYVHTQQTYRTTDATRWTTEGMADYYAAYLAYRQDRIGYDRYRRHLETAEDHRDAVLAEPETWSGTFANYDKGALVFAALDRQLRLESDGEATLQGVVRQFNNGTVERDEFLGAVEAVGGPDPRAYAERYTETDALPETWSQREQRDAFGGAQPRFTYEFAPPYDLTGPYRSTTVEANPTVVRDESLGMRVAVENTGSASGDYRAVLRANGEQIATRSDTLAPGDREVLTVDQRFTTRGSVRLTVGAASETVTVRDPATPRVTGIEAPRRAAPGDPVTLTARVGNPAARPANGTVTLAVDGEPLATERVRLDANGTTTVTATTRLEVGDHRVTAGSRERTVRVDTTTPTTPTPTDSVTRTEPVSPTGSIRSPTGAQAQGGTPTQADGPGVGALAALGALVVVGRAVAYR